MKSYLAQNKLIVFWLLWTFVDNFCLALRRLAEVDERQQEQAVVRVPNLETRKPSLLLFEFVFVLLFAWKLLGAPGLTTRSKDATRSFWPYY